MNTNFNISQDEKQRILEMHENSTKNHYLIEQAPPPIDASLPGSKEYQTDKPTPVKSVPPPTTPAQPQIDPKRYQQLEKYYAANSKNIKELQKMLNIKQDGYLGKNTYAAMMNTIKKVQGQAQANMEKTGTKDEPINVPENPAYTQAWK